MKHSCWNIRGFLSFCLKCIIFFLMFFLLRLDFLKPKDVIKANPGQFERVEILNKLEKTHLALGAQEMKKHKVAICGITRDNAKELPRVIKHIEYTGEQFADYRVIVFENDSRDHTKTILKKWQADNTKVRILMQDYQLKKRPNIQFLADIRNQYLIALEENPEYQDFDILMVVDLDMQHGWDMRGLFHSFHQFSNWDGVCSNGVFTMAGHMWDMFAFRNSEFPALPDNLEAIQYKTEIIPRGQRVYPVNSKLLPVYSCFGGLAFYKRAFITGCRYHSIKGDCEHVAFHQCLRKKQASLFMNPSQIIRYSHYQ